MWILVIAIAGALFTVGLSTGQWWWFGASAVLCVAGMTLRQKSSGKPPSPPNS